MIVTIFGISNAKAFVSAPTKLATLMSAAQMQFTAPPGAPDSARDAVRQGYIFATIPHRGIGLH
jgi:hypothetical protein